MKEKVGVLFGGASVEHDISIITAIQTMKFLPTEYEYIPIYIDKNGFWWTADNLQDVAVFEDFQKRARGKRRVSIVLGENKLLVKKNGRYAHLCNLSTVLNCCHGRIGEDGCVQGVFECCDVAQTSCDVTSSALCMDKVFMKNVFEANGVQSPKFVCLHKQEFEQNREECLKNIQKELTFPLIIKPANLGSSIGISVCEDFQMLEEAIEVAFAFDEKVIAEVVVQNLREFNCACFKFRGDFVTSAVCEVKDKTNIFTFEDKYLNAHQNGKDVEKNLAKKVVQLTEKVYKIFDCNGVVRADFLYDERAKVLYVNEINSIPGSLAFYLFKELPFKELLRALIEESFVEKDNKRRLLTTFDSDALKIFEEVKVECKK